MEQWFLFVIYSEFLKKLKKKLHIHFQQKVHLHWWMCTLYNELYSGASKCIRRNYNGKNLGVDIFISRPFLLIIPYFEPILNECKTLLAMNWNASNTHVCMIQMNEHICTSDYCDICTMKLFFKTSIVRHWHNRHF